MVLSASSEPRYDDFLADPEIRDIVFVLQLHLLNHWTPNNKTENWVADHRHC